METGWNPGGDAQLERDGRALRRVARVLVRDASAADDLVQEAWLVALERRGRAAQGGAFLAGVVRRLALGWRRDTARRAEQERASASESRSSRPDEVAERLEISELVLRTLRGLPEPYRSTLTLHFFDGLSAGAIARRSGVPAGTVRARLARGIEELRARLRPRLEQDGREWRQALLPLAGAVSGTTVAEGVLTIMGAKWALGGVAAAALMLLGWYSLRSDVAPDPAAGAPSGPARLESPDATALVDGSPRGEALRREAAEPTAEIVGKPATRVVARAVDEQGHPLADARLELVREGAQPGPLSGPSGALSLEFTGADAEWLEKQSEWCRLLARAPGRADASCTLKIQLDETNWLGDLVLATAGKLGGRVHAMDGRGLPGALVIATQEPVREDLDPWMGPGRLVTDGPRILRTDKEGRYEFAQLPEGWWIVWATDSARPWTPSERIAVVGGAWSGPIDLELGEADPARTLAGRVLEPDGKPCAKAAVMLLDASGKAPWDSQQLTLGDGRFEFHTREPGERLRVRALDDHERFAKLEHETCAGAGELVLQFGTPTPLHVRALDEAGKPVIGATVFAFSPTDRALFLGCNTSTDSEGDARLREPEASYSVLVFGQGFERAVQGPFEPGSAARELEFRLQRGAGLRGRVVAGGEGLPGAHLRLLGLARPGMRFEPLDNSERAGGWAEDVDPSCEWQADSIAGGRFTIGAPRSRRQDETRRFVLVAEARGWAPAVSAPLELASTDAREDLELVLTRGGSIEGQLSAPPTRPLEGWRIVASNGFHCLREAVVDPSGRFHLEHLNPGRWQLAPQPPAQLREWAWQDSQDAALARTQVFVEEGKTSRIVCELPPLEETFLEGRFDVGADPPGIWSVQLVPLSDTGDVERMSIRSLLGLDSTFRLPTHGYGRYRLLFECEDPRWGGAQVSDLVVLGAGGARWTGGLEFARLSGSVSPNTKLLFTFVHGPGDLRASTYFRPGEQGRIGERWIPRGRVLITDEPHPPGEPIEHPLATIEAREGVTTTIELH